MLFLFYVATGPSGPESFHYRGFKRHSVGLLWTRDHPDALTSLPNNTQHSQDRHPHLRRYSNPHYQQANGRRPTL